MILLSRGRGGRPDLGGEDFIEFMLPAILTTVLFSLSTLFAGRSSRILGGAAANFWRLTIGTVMLGMWAHLAGAGLRGPALGVFLLSGLIGFGFGDAAYYQALVHLGPRLTILMVQCLAAPIAALVEWAWLGSALTARQMAFGATILTGVALALAPPARKGSAPRVHADAAGIFFGVAAGTGQGLGAVLSRRAFGMTAAAGASIDSVSAAYQRILGGLGLVGIFLLWRWLRSGGRDDLKERHPDHSRAWMWVLANATAGCVLGVSCYQWALKTTGTGIVLSIVATAPIVIIPFSYWMDGEKPSPRSLAGGLIAVAGVVGLTVFGGK